MLASADAYTWQQVVLSNPSSLSLVPAAISCPAPTGTTAASAAPSSEPRREVDVSAIVSADNAVYLAETAYGVSAAGVADVLSHVVSHPSLLDSLPLACGLVRQRFGRSVALRLSLFVSHEDDADRFLVLSVDGYDAAPPPLEQLFELRDEYAALAADLDEWVLITTDHR